MTDGLHPTLRRSAMRIILAVIAGISVAVGSATVSASPGMAQEELREGYTDSGTTVVDDCPEEYRDLAGGECIVEDVLEVSAEQILTSDQIAEVAELTDAYGVRLGDAAPLATIYYVN